MTEQNDFIEAIEERVDDSIGELDTTLPPPVVEAEPAAQTALYRVVTRDKKIADIRKQADDLREQVTRWEEMQVGVLENEKRYFLLTLQSFMEALNRNNPNIKTIKMPFGSIGVRKESQTAVVDEHFKPQMDIDSPFVKQEIVYKIDKLSLNEAAKNGEELPNWAAIKPESKKFWYKGDV